MTREEFALRMKARVADAVFRRRTGGELVLWIEAQFIDIEKDVAALWLETNPVARNGPVKEVKR